MDETRREWFKRRLHFGLGRFASRIRRVRVSVADVNGPRGGVDVKCVLQVLLERSGTLVVEAVDEEVESAAACAVDRMARRVRDEIERRRGSRHRGTDAWDAASRT